MITEKQKTALKLDAAKQCRYDIARLAISVPIRIDERFPGLLRIHKHNIILSKELVENFPYSDILYVFVHGLLCILLKHEKRGSTHTLTQEERFIWSLASEICRSVFMKLTFPNIAPMEVKFLNEDALIKAASVALPNRTVTGTECVEDIYYILKDCGEEIKKLQAQSEVGEAGEASPVETDEETSEGAGEGEALDDMMLESVNEVTLKNMMKDMIRTLSRGLASAPGEVQYFATDYFPELNKDVYRIRAFLRSLSGKGQGKYREGERPRRRNPTNVKLKQIERMSFGRVAVIADVSGSTSEHRERLFQGLVAAVKACDRIDIFIGDTTILREKVGVTSANQIQGLDDGLGTDMGAIMKDVDKRGYHSIVVISDGQTPWPEEPLHADAYYFPFGDFTLEGVPEWIKIV